MWLWCTTHHHLPRRLCRVVGSVLSEARLVCSSDRATLAGSRRIFVVPFSITSRSYCSVNIEAVSNRVARVLQAKSASGLTYDELSDQLGVTNAYCAQLLLGQAKLSQATAVKLQQALPSIPQEDILAMQQDFPMRSFDDNLLKEPNVYRTYEAIMHNGEAIKAIINEQCGDGIMSAIDFYLDVGTTTGKHGEKRVVITFNGKFLPFIEQKTEDNGAQSPRD